MKDIEEKFIQLYGKVPLLDANKRVYENKKKDFVLGYECGFDAAMEYRAVDEDWLEEMSDNLDLERGG